MRRPQARRIGVEIGKQRHAGPQTGSATFDVVFMPTGQRFRAMERVAPPARRHRVEPTRELSLGARGLVAKRQHAIDGECRQFVRIGSLVLPSLRLDPLEACPDLLRLDDADRLAIDEEDIVRGTGCGRDFTDCNTLSGSHRCARVILHHPAAGCELLVDIATGRLLGAKLSVIESPDNDHQATPAVIVRSRTAGMRPACPERIQTRGTSTA